MKNPDSLNATRRGFIHKLLVATGGLFALTAAGKVTAQEAAPGKPVEQAQSSGYRESEHVRAYYRAARF